MSFQAKQIKTPDEKIKELSDKINILDKGLTELSIKISHIQQQLTKPKTRKKGKLCQQNLN